MSSLFVSVTLSERAIGDAELGAKLEEVCPVGIFAATESGSSIVDENVDECILCDLCLRTAPEGDVSIVKLYE